MNTCDTCRWWVKENTIAVDRSDGMVCGNVNKLSSELDGEDTCGCHAFTDHASGLMRTGPKFGCVHHEAKS